MPEACRVVLATRNRHKISEILGALDLPGVTLESLDEHPGIPPFVEDGETFEANAVRKARTVAEATCLPALADDSGLEVDALGGEPGVRSARFAGPDADDVANRQLLLRRLEGVESGERGARFVCVLALALPGGTTRTVEGRCEGRILARERGEGGFGYDPVFVPEGEERTFAQMSRAEKAEFSHRGRALRRARDVLREVCARPQGAPLDTPRADP